MERQGFFAVFDGHGGRSAAAWCGDHFHELLLKNLGLDPTSPSEDSKKETPNESEDKDGNTIRYSYSQEVSTSDEADLKHLPVSEILDHTFEEADSYLTGAHGIFSGSTAVVALIRPEIDDDHENGNHGEEKLVLYTANVGDSRAVLFRDGKAIRLSYDHKGSDLIEQQRVRDAGGFILNDRVNGMLAITRALGDAEMKDFIAGRPYTTETTLDASKDTILILACDGLWDVCGDQEACELIANVEDPMVASEMLVDYALKNGTYDNLSVLVVRLFPTPKVKSHGVLKSKSVEEL